jgi:hypothetical protein
MRILNAYSIGKKVNEIKEDNLIGSVHSVFNKVINLDIEGDLYSITAKNVPKTPYSISLPLSDLTKLNIFEDQASLLDESKLKIGKSLSCDIKDASIWSPKSKENTVEIMQSEKSLSGSINNYGKPSGMKPILDLFGETTSEDNIFSKKARMILKKLLSDNLNKKTVLEETSKLVGLGPGLTPSGDDLLCGVLATLFLLRLPDEANYASQSISNHILKVGQKQTNSISNSFLKHYSCGMIDETFDNLMIALENNSEPQLDEAVEKICSFGHSSGTDLAIGVLFAINLKEKLVW